jgi:hypothetical protein
MQMWPGGSSGGADPANKLAATYFMAEFDIEF